MGKKSVKVIAAVVAGLASIPAVFLASLEYFWRMVQGEYASGERVSTGGDTVMIPAVGVTTVWIGLLLVVGGTLLIMRIVRKSKRRAAVIKAVAADGACAPPLNAIPFGGRRA
jgi:hypothetical protein